MPTKSLYVLLLLQGFLVACDDTGDLQTIDQLNVQAFLHAGSYLDSLHISKVIPLDSLEAEAAPEDLQPMVLLENGEVVSLSYTGSEGVYSNSDLWIEADQSYRLEIDYQGELLSADTYVPPAPENLQLDRHEINRTRIDDFTDLLDQVMTDPIEVTWTAEAGAYYFVNVTNLEENPVVINTLFEEGNRPPRPDILTEPSTNDFYNIDTFRDLTHFGTYQVVVYRVNPEYVALYEDGSGSTGSLNEVRTNVVNGFGIFTGINSDTAYFEVRQQ